MADFRNPISIMMQNKGKIYVKKFIILLFWLGVWQILAMCVDNFLLVVTPLQALRALLTLAGQVEFWRSAFDSLWRIAFGFLLGAVLALLLAAISYRYPLAEEVLRPFMVFCKAVPVAVFAVLLLIWWGSSMLAVAICFLVVFPNIYLNTLEGLKSADRGLLEMAEVFRLPLGTQFFYIYRPALKAFFAQRVSAISGNVLEVRSGGGSDWHSQSFHRWSTVSGEDLSGYGGSVCLDSGDRSTQCIF